MTKPNLSLVCLHYFKKSIKLFLVTVKLDLSKKLNMLYASPHTISWDLSMYTSLMREKERGGEKDTKIDGERKGKRDKESKRVKLLNRKRNKKKMKKR